MLVRRVWLMRSSLSRALSWWMEMSLVSMTRWARSRRPASSARSLRMPSMTLPPAGQRVPAARLLEAAHQRLVGRLEEDERVLDAALVQLVEQLLELAEVLAAAHVADDGDAVDLAALAAEEVDERRHQLRRQVVDAEPAGVLERVHGLRLAGPGEAGDDHELQRLGHVDASPPRRRTPSSASRRSFQAGSSP